MKKKDLKKKAKETLPETLPLVPPKLLFLLWLAALGLPNLVYAGPLFYDTLFIAKWVAAGAPLAIALLAAGLRLLWYGRRRMRLALDPFTILLGVMLLYCAAQPLWVDVSSKGSLAQELLCFGAVWAFCVLSASSFPDWGLRPLLWAASLNAAANVLFAELQTRGLFDLAFLEGTPLEFLTPLRALVYPSPEYYFGNVRQKNMFGLWMAVCVLGGAYLLLAHVLEGRKKRFAWGLNLCLMAVNLVGLWKVASRSGLLSLAVGLLVLALLGARRTAYRRRLGLVLLVLVAAAGVRAAFDVRLDTVADRLRANVRNIQSFSGRTGLWRRSFDMLRLHPMGVGLGQYKWHFMEAQRETFRTHPEERFRYTLWAHNEFIQWFCEAGLIGGAMLLLLCALWLAAVFRGVRSGRELPLPVLWACAMVVLFAFNALWTRPFHRIEMVLWLALAFGLANREFLKGWDVPGALLRPAGAAAACAALAGLLYLGGGVEGNLLLRQAVSTPEEGPRLRLLEEAGRYPTIREEAVRIRARHHILAGNQRGDNELIRKGFDLFWDSFQREPMAADRGLLLYLAQIFQEEDIIREIASYAQPGTYQFKRVPATDPEGRQVEALIVVGPDVPEESPEALLKPFSGDTVIDGI